MNIAPLDPSNNKDKARRFGLRNNWRTGFGIRATKESSFATVAPQSFKASRTLAIDAARMGTKATSTGVAIPARARATG